MKRDLLLTVLFLLLAGCNILPATATTPPTIPNVTVTVQLTDTPTSLPTITATSMPTSIPTVIATSMPTSTPTVTPSSTPTSSPTITATSMPTLNPAPPSELTVKVLSYNVLCGAGDYPSCLSSSGQSKLAGRSRLTEFLSFLKRADPDILGIQEANGWNEGSPPVVQQVAQELGMNYFLAETTYGFHIALLTKFKIFETANIRFAAYSAHGALRAILLAPDGQPINVFVAHLDPNLSTRRLIQVNTIIEEMQPYMPQRTILMGDMNFRYGSPEYARLGEANLKLVAEEHRMGIDQIWISPAVSWSKNQWFQYLVLPVGVSDHNPIGAEIKMTLR